jgi:hypothetical protein
MLSVFVFAKFSEFTCLTRMTGPAGDESKLDQCGPYPWYEENQSVQEDEKAGS